MFYRWRLLLCLLMFSFHYLRLPIFFFFSAATRTVLSSCHRVFLRRCVIVDATLYAIADMSLMLFFRAFSANTAYTPFSLFRDAAMPPLFTTYHNTDSAAAIFLLITPPPRRRHYLITLHFAACILRRCH